MHGHNRSAMWPARKKWPFDAECLEMLHRHLQRHRLATLLDDMPEHEKIEDVPAGTICDIIEHLVYKDYIVALDEVHNCAEHSGLPSELKKLIDRLSCTENGRLVETRQPPPRDHLILMGSH